mgnify:FL=1
MSELLITIVTAVISSAASGWAGWFFARRKYNAEVESNDLQNLRDRVQVVNDIVDTLKTELDRLNTENSKLREENDLMDRKITNLTTIILNHGINIKKELRDVEKS